jgi:hypothetical protein
MDRMSFIPGREAREEIEEAGGHISMSRDAVIDFLDSVATPRIFGPPGGSTLYLALLACLSIGDKLDIYYGLRDYEEGEERDPGGELVGFTWAVMTESSGKERKLWEVGRRSLKIDDRFAVDAFNLYRTTLGSFQKAHVPQPRSYNPPVDLPSELDISRSLSPSNLYYCSGIMFYFVVFSSSAPSRPDFCTSPRWLSRPMRAYDALLLSGLLTIVVGAPPLVFAVVQRSGGLGVMPQDFERAVYVSMLDDQGEFVAEGNIAIVM